MVYYRNKVILVTLQTIGSGLYYFSTMLVLLGVGSVGFGSRFTDLVKDFVKT